MAMFNYQAFMTGKIKKIERILELICEKLGVEIPEICPHCKRELTEEEIKQQVCQCGEKLSS